MKRGSKIDNGVSINRQIYVILWHILHWIIKPTTAATQQVELHLYMHKHMMPAYYYYED